MMTRTWRGWIVMEAILTSAEHLEQRGINLKLSVLNDAGEPHFIDFRLGADNRWHITAGDGIRKPSEQQHVWLDESKLFGR